MINISGSDKIDAPPIEVWTRLFNVESLINLVPGCQELEQTRDGEYQGRIQVGVAAVSGTYDIYLKVVKHDETLHCDIDGEVSGPTGIIKGDGTFTLKEVEDYTNIEYEAGAIITGALAKINPTIIEGIVQALIKQGMKKLDKQIRA